MNNGLRWCAAGLCLWLLSCANKSNLRYDKLSKNYQNQDYTATIQTIHKNKKLYGERNRFLFYMDIGALFHYNQNYDSSNIYLEKAAKTYDELFSRSVTNEALSILTNDNIRPYRSKPYELVMLHEYMMLNYLAQGKKDEALVEARRAQLLFDEWERKGGEKYTTDGMFHYTSALAYENIGEKDNALISLFKSVQAYQKGVIRLPNEIKREAYFKFKANDRDGDIQKLKLTISDDGSPNLELSPNQGEIILVGYAGRGPILGERVWWGTYIRGGMLIVHHRNSHGDTVTVALPAPQLPEKEYRKAQEGRKTKLGTTFHVKFATPELKTLPSLSSYFTVEHNSLKSPKKTMVLNNLDEMLKQHLEDTHTATISRTVVRVVLRTISSQKTKSSLSGSNPLVNLLMNIGTDVLADQLEQADLRSCFLIPKTVQMARIPVEPGTHNITAKVHNHSGGILGSRDFSNIKVGPGEKRVIFYSSLL